MKLGVGASAKTCLEGISDALPPNTHIGSRACWKGRREPLKVIQQGQGTSSCVLGAFFEQQLGAWTEAPEELGPAFASTREMEYDARHWAPL